MTKSKRRVVGKLMLQRASIGALAFCIAPVALPGAAFAQTAATEVEDSEIVVTARRREELLQETPVSVSAFSAENLEARGIQDISELSDFTPNLNFLTSSGINGGQIALAFIRGVGQPEVFLQNDPGVGIYVDGVYFGRTQGAVFDVLDIQRVEVLRGPQGTLYGRNTIGGAINLISQRPSDAFEAVLDIEAGAYDLASGRLRVSGPLAGDWAGSLTIAARERDGFAEANPHPACSSCTNEDLSGESFLAGRAALEFAPAGNFSLLLAADYTERDQTPIARRLAFYNPAINPLFPFADYNAAVLAAWGVPASSFVNTDPNTHSANFAGFDIQEVWGASATAEWDISSALALKLISGYRELDFQHSSDSDGSPLMINSILLEHVEQSQFSQEVQLLGSAFGDRLEWILGAFYMHEDASSLVQQTQNFTEAGLIIPFPPPGVVIPCFNAADPLGSCPPRPPIIGELNSDNYAVFAHGVFNLTERLSISGGVRYSVEEKEFDSIFFVSESFADDWESFTPRIGVEYQASDDLMLYASYAEGFKSGTFNNGTDPTFSRSVEPETAESYELGVKSEWFDHRVRLNAAAFWTAYEGQQLQIPTTAFDFAFTNVASSEISGYEVELFAHLTDFLRLDAGLGFTDSEITEVDVATPGVAQGARLARVPEYTANVGLTLTQNLADIGQLETRLDYIYRDGQEGDFTNHANVRTESYDLVNLRVALTPNDALWRVELWGENIFSTEYETARASIAPDFFAVAVDGAPSTYGVRFSIRNQ